MKYFNSLTTVNIELTNKCNKNCWCCGRRKIEKEYPHLIDEYKDMDFELVKKIVKQLPDNIVVQFHNNGESLLYPRFGEAVALFKNQIKCLDTNAKLLLKKSNEIIDNLDTLTISVLEHDHESNKQYDIVKDFVALKGDKKPLMIYRLLGNVGLHKEYFLKEKKDRWYKLPGIIATRILHNPMGSFKYTKKVTVPEIGICTEILNHLIINSNGKIFPCVRFNPYNYNLLGNANEEKLIDIWNSKQRLQLIQEHIKGNRNCSELCSKCEYWGIPRGD